MKLLETIGEGKQGGNILGTIEKMLKPKGSLETYKSTRIGMENHNLVEKPWEGGWETTEWWLEGKGASSLSVQIFLVSNGHKNSLLRFISLKFCL